MVYLDIQLTLWPLNAVHMLLCQKSGQKSSYLTVQIFCMHIVNIQFYFIKPFVSSEYDHFKEKI